MYWKNKIKKLTVWRTAERNENVFFRMLFIKLMCGIRNFKILLRFSLTKSDVRSFVTSACQGRCDVATRSHEIFLPKKYFYLPYKCLTCLKKFSLQKMITSLYSIKLSKIKTVISVLGMDLVSIKSLLIIMYC